MKYSAGALIFGVLLLVLATVVPDGFGHVLAGVAVVFVGVGSLFMFGRLSDESRDRLNSGGEEIRREMERGRGPFGL